MPAARLAASSRFYGAVLAPLSMLRDMDSLQFTSGIAMACIVYAVGVIVLTPAGAPAAAAAPIQSP